MKSVRLKKYSGGYTVKIFRRIVIFALLQVFLVSAVFAGKTANKPTAEEHKASRCFKT